MKNIMLFIIDIYKLYISPFLRNRCRFYPTCSSYIKMAIIKFGFYQGIIIGIRRLLKCHPFCVTFGYDPIPEKINKISNKKN